MSQTGSNWPLPWFPQWKEPLEEGGAKGGVVGVSHDHTEKCLMSCDVFGRAMHTHTDGMAVKMNRGDLAQSVSALFVESPLTPD